MLQLFPIGQIAEMRAIHTYMHMYMYMYMLYVALGKLPKKKKFFWGNLSQMWVVGVADSQTRSKPLKTPPNCPENRLFRPKFHLSFSQISQKPLGG